MIASSFPLLYLSFGDENNSSVGLFKLIFSCMISGKNLHKQYGKVEVLKGVDMEIRKGEIVSIVGPSGSGKSTLLHILGTLDQPDSGFTEVSGVKIEYQPRIKWEPAPWWKRLINSLLDMVIVLLLAQGIAMVSGLPARFYQSADPVNSLRFSWEAYVYHALVIILYYSLQEWLLGRTPAKYVSNTKVIVAQEGTRPPFLACLIRALSRLIPFEAFSFLAARPVGWHDALAGTMVVNNNRPYVKKLSNRLSPRELSQFRNKHIGFVFQFHHLLPEFTALENVCIPGWLAGRRKSEVREEAIKLLAMLGLSQRMDNKPNQLSGGEQQRVAVARALINKPDIIFADEPTGNLDSANARDLHQLFFDLRQQFNQTFLIVTHNEELARLSDRVLHMRDGKIVAGE